MRLIETSHLKTWASSKPAESRFPYIVKALILGVVQPEKLRMPSGDAVWAPGFDGVVMYNEENRFVQLVGLVQLVSLVGSGGLRPVSLVQLV